LLSWGSLLAAGLLAVGLSSCQMTSIPLWRPEKPSDAQTWEVATIRDVPYVTGPEASPRHHLDLLLPKGREHFPVVVLVHGGTWIHGDNRCCGLYSSVGEFLASQGIGVVMPNYRLSPWVKHPAHVQDVARAVAWTHAHIAEHGGDPARLILAGHSAGGHLVSLLATDERYLKAEGMTTADIKGVISVSGVYHITEGSVSVTLGGTGPNALRLDQFMPLRGACGGFWSTGLPGLPIRLNVFAPAFGNDARQREDASPVNHVRPGLPPFLLVVGDHDLPMLADMAEDFRATLRDAGDVASGLTVKDRNHHSVFFQAISTTDPVGAAVLAFVREWSR
jgi:acetyl esterase/lipase